MTSRYFITFLLLSTQIIGIVTAILWNAVEILIISTTFSSIFLFFNNKIFRNDIEVFGSFVILFIAVVLSFYNYAFVLLTSIPLVFFITVVIARQFYINIYHCEPETGKYLFWQRDRMYSWILFNVLMQIMYFFILKPWESGSGKIIWFPILFIAMQLPLLLFAWLTKWYLNKKRKNRRKKADWRV